MDCLDQCWDTLSVCGLYGEGGCNRLYMGSKYAQNVDVGFKYEKEGFTFWQ